jgi:hypothetical protein
LEDQEVTGDIVLVRMVFVELSCGLDGTGSGSCTVAGLAVLVLRVLLPERFIIIIIGEYFDVK